jgi:peptide/nickel transport system substrate-binding protein
VSIRRLAAILILLCVACGGPEKPAQTTSAAALPNDDTPRDGGTLNRRLDLDVVTLNPVITTSRYDRFAQQYLFTPLIHIDRDLKPIPGLAESWEISDDGLLYTFKLNPKATFSDGTPVRASDVLFTLKKIVDPAVEAVQIAGSFEHIDLTRTRVVDEHTIEVAFRQPLAAQLLKFNDVLTIPEHVYSKGDFRKDFNDRAVGSGPYTLVRRVPGKEVVVQRRADYWDRKPYIQTVVMKVINDHGTAFNALRLGQIDETMIASDTWVRERNNPALANKIDFQRFYTLNYNYIGWNNRNPLLSDKRVRRALTMCVPIESIINDLYHGTSRAMSGPFTPDEWAYNPNVPAVRYNPEEAKQLFAAAGWKDNDGDGVLDKDGRKFSLTLLTMTGSATARQIGQMVQSELKKAGVALELEVMDGAMAIQRILAGNFEACYLSWDLDPDPDPFILFHSSQFPPRGQNFVFYANPEADRLIEAARREMDQSKRRDLYWRLHEVLVEDQPYTWVVQVSAKWGVNKRVHNVQASRGNGFFNWYPGEFDWWIAAER